ncbi:thioesterase II family protein [Streptomyces sp. NPDC094038]|uniref:thioesterase II family protein n=1 Tax=Streptomyces sp. NPDC094038 TaxID=3366055 RepID=UPI0038308D99
MNVGGVPGTSSVLFPLETRPRPQEPPVGLPLIAVPHAGGTAHAFRGWTAPARDRGLMVYGVRTATPAARRPEVTLRARARALAESLAALPEPAVLVGHSLGGVIAAEAVQYLEQYAPKGAPALLVVCATNPPHLRRPVPAPNGTEAEAVDFLRRVGGTPPEVFDDPRMQELAVAMLLTDLAALRGFQWSGRRITTPIAVYAGQNDPVAPPESLAEWTGAAESVTTRVFDSGHFFPHERTAEVLDAIRLDLASRATAPSLGRAHTTQRP